MVLDIERHIIYSMRCIARMFEVVCTTQVSIHVSIPSSRVLLWATMKNTRLGKAFWHTFGIHVIFLEIMYMYAHSQ